jgi:murein DD-endopeptidase MepM/ murein hydrolase activator NlpD
MAVASLVVGIVGSPLPTRSEPRAVVSPAVARPGEVAVVELRGVDARASVEGTLGGRPLAFFPTAGGLGALAGIDLEASPGAQEWQIALVDADGVPAALRGAVLIEAREFPVERLSLPKGMVELDAETTRRAEAEARRLRQLYARSSPQRLWRGPFVAPVETARRIGGFGARRVINGLTRSPHAGLDYAADRGAPVMAMNAGRVVLTGEFFFPGRLVVIDHGLGLYSAYFHLDRITVAERDPIAAGAPIGTVGATGRATGPHLHVAVTLGSARVDPAALLGLRIPGDD